MDPFPFSGFGFQTELRFIEGCLPREMLIIFFHYHLHVIGMDQACPCIGSQLDLFRGIAEHLEPLPIAGAFPGQNIFIPQTKIGPGYGQLQPLFALMQRFPRPLLLGDIRDEDQVGGGMAVVVGQGGSHDPPELYTPASGSELKVVGWHFPPGHPPGKVAHHLQLALPGQEGETQQMFPEDFFPGEPEPVKEPVVHLQEPELTVEENHHIWDEFEDPTAFFFAFFERGNSLFCFP